MEITQAQKDDLEKAWGKLLFLRESISTGTMRAVSLMRRDLADLAETSVTEDLDSVMNVIESVLDRKGGTL